MAKFTKRTTAPAKSDKHYYSDNIFYACGYGMPNCTAYAWGRLYEITGKRHVPLHGNAEEWWAAADNAGLKKGQTPKLGAIVCWRAGNPTTGSDGAGHVAVVEEIKPNGDIVTSNSAWKGTNFYMQIVTKASGYQYSSNRPFQGFIYCGLEFDNDNVVVPQPETPPVKIDTELRPGDVIQLRPGCTYWNGKPIPSWVLKKTLYYRKTNEQGIVFSTLKSGAITGVVKPEDAINAKASTTEAPITKGSRVMVKKGAKTYNGVNLASFVYKRQHVVKSIDGDRVVITYQGIVVAAINIKDLTKV